jgi:beta-mannanase
MLTLAVVCLLFVGSGPASGESGKAWGVYQIYWQPLQFEQQLDEQLASLGGQCKYTLFFRDLSPKRGFPKSAVEICRQRGLTPVISFELWEWSRHRQDGGLQEIEEGKLDAFFAKWAREAAAYGHPVILRFGFEMNGDWFAWGRQPERFKKVWRHVHAIVRANRADNISWMFAPNVLSPGQDPKEHLYPYYPGDDVVDWVGLDGYNFGDHHDKWHAWSTYQKIFEPTIRAAQAWGKPLLISEVGCADDGRKAEWMKNFLQTVSADDRIRAFIYFNYDKRRGGEPNWRIGSDPKTLEVFRGWAR